MKTFKISAAQGEVNVRRVAQLPDGLRPVIAENGAYVVGHSESGHHHIIKADDSVQVMEKISDVPAGMKIFYAILEQPIPLTQSAASPHDAVMLDPGIFCIKISREFDPFAEQMRRVAD